MNDLDETQAQCEPMSSPPSAARAQEISALLAQQGIPARRQRSFLSNILGSSYANTRRRLLGEIPFSTDELDLIANHLGLSLTFHFAPLLKEPPVPAAPRLPDRETKSLPAKIEIQGLDLDCLVEESPKPMIPPAADSLGLQRNAGDEGSVYRVVRSAEAPSQHALTALSSITILPVYARSGPSLAIVVEATEEGESLMRCLSTAGFRTELFSAPVNITPTPSSGQPQQPTRAFDAYLIDFDISRAEDIERMISSVRHVQPQAAVVLMSDKLGEDLVTEAAARLIGAHGVSLIPKPSPTFAIVAQLRHEIERLRQQDSKRIEPVRTLA